jgi:hypothetical protein
VAAGHASRGSGYRRPEIPKDRSRLCPPLPMAIHPQTAHVPAAGKGDRAWGDVVARLEQPPRPRLRPLTGKEAGRGVARDRTPRRKTARASPLPADVTRSRMHLCSRGMDGGPAGTGRRRETLADHQMKIHPVV